MAHPDFDVQLTLIDKPNNLLNSLRLSIICFFVCFDFENSKRKCSNRQSTTDNKSRNMKKTG